MSACLVLAATGVGPAAAAAPSSGGRVIHGVPGTATRQGTRRPAAPVARERPLGRVKLDGPGAPRIGRIARVATPEATVTPAAPAALGTAPAVVGTYPFLVTKLGDGDGVVTAMEGVTTVMTCPVGTLWCWGYFDVTVDLTATAAPTTKFIGWGGDCSGTGVCTLGAGEHSVTATFVWLAELQLPPSIQAKDGTSADIWPNALAVSADQMAIASNSSASIELIDRHTLEWSRFPTSLLFGAEPTNPQSVTVIWDLLSQRWYAAELIVAGCNSTSLRLALSDTADAFGTWTVYTQPLTGNARRVSLGTTTNKILVGYQDTGSQCAGTVPPIGATIDVFDVADLLAGGASVPVSEVVDGALRDPMIAASLVPTLNGYAAAVGSGNLQQVMVVSGTNAASSVMSTSYAVPSINPLTPILGDYGVFNQAFWNGRLWTSGGGNLTGFVVDAVAFAGGSWSVSEEMTQTGPVGGSVGVALDGTVYVLLAAYPPNGPCSGPCEVGMYAAIHPTTDPANTFRKPAWISAGHLASVTFDPSDTHGVQAADTSVWVTHVSGASTGPAGTATLNGGATSTYFLRVGLELTPDAGASVTQVRISNDPTMVTFQLRPVFGGALGWQLANAAYGGSQTGGTRHVYVQWGNGAGTWSGVASATIAVDPSVPISRLAGPDRYATAAAISNAGFAPGVDTVYIATGQNFPDALAGAAVAGRDGSPILYAGATLPVATQTELTRLNPGRIVILGGVGAVSLAVEASLHSFTTGTVTRLAGSSRFATAAAISQASFNPGVEDVFIAYAYNFPDALAAAPIAAIFGEPILFSATNSISADTVAELQRLQPKDIIVLGGPGVISDAVALQLAQYTTTNTAYRIAGPDRYSTAAVLASVFGTQIDVAFLASGLGYPDALAGAAVAGWYGGPILYANLGLGLPQATINGLCPRRPMQAFILGGTGVIKSSVYQDVNMCLAG